MTVAGGAAVTGASEIARNDKQKSPPAATKPGERLGQVAPRGVLVPGNGVARGKATAPGQVKSNAASAHRTTRLNAAKRHKSTKPATAASGKRVAGAKRQDTPTLPAPKPNSSNSPTTSSSDQTVNAPQSSGVHGGGKANGGSNGNGASTTASTESKPVSEKSGGKP